ncbi:D-3-phosphoglycerate dehydrogenase [Arctopsyche grandis]|uniref:D-3-phosphoglycerate dehydrogenase n=1 Tax=Arctopsyche grandis TaxID=121162 RepID=UPI00406D63F7
MIPIMSVLISDAVDSRCADKLEENGIAVTIKTKMPKAELLEEIKYHDALIVRSSTQVTREVIESGSKLKVVGRAGAGVDNIDVNAATENNVLVLNTPGGNAISACELTCGLISSLARHIPQGAASLKSGLWERTKFQGSELDGKTLAVLGLGRVGKEVAIRMNAFGMRIIGYDPIVSAEDAKAYNTEKMELVDIWPLADYITVHTPLMDSTRNLISAKVLSKCKKGIFIVNVGRGGLVNESDLLEGLKSDHVGGAALDVFEQEPPTDAITLELIQHPRVIATPHLGASTAEAQVRVAVEVAEQFIALSDATKTAVVQICAVNPTILSS